MVKQILSITMSDDFVIVKTQEKEQKPRIQKFKPNLSVKLLTREE